VPNVAMAEIGLQGPGVALVSQCIAASVPEHLGVCLKARPRFVPEERAWPRAVPVSRTHLQTRWPGAVPTTVATDDFAKLALSISWHINAVATTRSSCLPTQYDILTKRPSGFVTRVTGYRDLPTNLM
jgi:hypothetical protein